jgi:long-chain-fatty-acid---luciferin-component ligase
MPTQIEVAHSVLQRERSVNAIESIDQLLSASDVYRTSPQQVAEVRLRQIKSSVEFHHDNHSGYGRYCARLGFDPTRLKSTDDLWRVPLLPSALFKRRDTSLRTPTPLAASDDALETMSSGTQGSVSIVPRDNVTLMRFFASVSCGVREVLGVDDFATPVYNLGPSPEEAAHLWIAYVLAGASVVFNSRNYVTGGELQLARLTSELSRCDRSLVVIGPPALLLDLAENTPATLRLQHDSLVVSVGGWKRAGARTIDREAFRRTVGSALGLAPEQIRDAYNMVELNSVIFECAHGRKHLPPWLYAAARHPRSLELLGDGEPGILSFLDPSAVSYPAFILSDDFGSVTRAASCSCGLRTDVLQIERRINRIESRGCALKMNYASSQKGVRS